MTFARGKKFHDVGMSQNIVTLELLVSPNPTMEKPSERQPTIQTHKSNRPGSRLHVPLDHLSTWWTSSDSPALFMDQDITTSAWKCKRVPTIIAFHAIIEDAVLSTYGHPCGNVASVIGITYLLTPRYQWKFSFPCSTTFVLITCAFIYIWSTKVYYLFSYTKILGSICTSAV